MMENHLKKIPGIGERMAQHLIRAGYPDIQSLKKQVPEEIYLRDCMVQEKNVDLCALYVYRLAVYYAENDGKLPSGKQNWWNWKKD